jgi:DNA-binding MarR family transcriptional regulator
VKQLSKKTKQKGSEVPEDGLSDYDRLVLAAITSEAHRAGAIVHIIKKTIDRNQVVQILNKLEKNGLVERTSTKAWKAVA